MYIACKHRERPVYGLAALDNVLYTVCPLPLFEPLPGSLSVHGLSPPLNNYGTTNYSVHFSAHNNHGFVKFAHVSSYYRSQIDGEFRQRSIIILMECIIVRVRERESQQHSVTMIKSNFTLFNEQHYEGLL